jgi:hypothetical protein
MWRALGLASALLMALPAGAQESAQEAPGAQEATGKQPVQASEAAPPEALQARHAAVLEGRDPILIERSLGPLPRYQVRTGAETRAAANELCGRIHKGGGDCAVLRNPQG